MLLTRVRSLPCSSGVMTGRFALSAIDTIARTLSRFSTREFL